MQSCIQGKCRKYLTRRRQITKVNDAESSMRENNFGVPQSSILGKYTSTILKML